MLLTLNKIGKIEEAKINITGLTVIAGKNDTGKSTVGKVLYALLKALGTYAAFFEDSKLSLIRQNLLLPLLQRVNSLPSTPISFSKEIGTVIDWLRAPMLFKDEENLTEQKILNLLERIQNQFNEQIPQELGNNIDEILLELEKIKVTPDFEKAKISFDFQLKSIFSGTINNSKYHEIGTIGIINQGKKILNAQIEKDAVTSFSLDAGKAKSLYGKPIYIESPFVLEKIFALDKPNWNDIMRLFRGNSNPLDRISINTEMLDFIQKTIFQNAKFSFDTEKNDFCYQVDMGATKLALLDVASGIKSFALIFSLLQQDYLTKDSLLILDEPENHLHPEWQIKYAEMVCLMVSKGFSIVLTSHSPTFIQALEAYGRKFQIQDKASFYLAEKIENKNYSRLTDVTSNTERIAENLIEPMDKLFLGV